MRVDISFHSIESIKVNSYKLDTGTFVKTIVIKCKDYLNHDISHQLTLFSNDSSKLEFKNNQE